MEHSNSYLKTADLKSIEEFCRLHGAHMTFMPGETFQKAGVKVRSVGFLVRGGIRYSCSDSNGMAHIVGYVFDNGFFADYSSYLRDIPARLEITFAEETEAYIVSAEKLRDSTISGIGPEKMLRLVSEDLFVRTETKMLEFCTRTPEERYIGLLQDSPDIFRRIPLKDIARYIGIAPETLSRIRRRITVRKAEEEHLPGGGNPT